MRFRATLRRCGADDRGATAIEYALIAAMMAVVVISISGTGGAVEALYDTFGLTRDAMAEANSR